MADDNEWAEILFPLVNDCLAGLLSWEDFQAEVEREAKRLGYKLEPQPLAAAERETQCRKPTDLMPEWRRNALAASSGKSSSPQPTSSRSGPSEGTMKESAGSEQPIVSTNSEPRSSGPTQRALIFTKE